ncbi:Fc.00g080970.m01.CDS01 [Cosmosporella sp. VM-42]
MLACISCKQKKLKCDGHSPRCQNCSKTGRECLVEDPATGLHRPRDYMQSLEARVAYLEGLLQQSRPDVALDHLLGFEGSRFVPQLAGGDQQVDPSGANNVQHDMSGVSIQDDVQGAASIDAEDPADQLSAEVALLCLNAAGREPHYFGPSSAVSFSRIVSAAMNLPKKVGSSQRSIVEAENIGWGASRPVPVGFPLPALASKLSTAYFDNFHSQYPFLHRPTFQLWEEACIKANASGNLAVVGDVPQFFVWMVYAIALLALGPAHYNTAESYYAMALEHQQGVLELDSLESIQSLLCCAVYSIRSPAGASLWKLSGVAIRHCIELGYHRSVSRYRKNSNPIVAEMSKRCFWVAYDIDRVASFILGRPVGIADDSIDAELPLDIDDENITPGGLLKEPRSSYDDPPTNMTGAIHVIKLRRLWSKISDNIYPPITKSGENQGLAKKPLIDGLAQELEEWHNSIPYPPDHSGSDPLSVFASHEWFRLAYDHSVLILYRHWITHVPPPGEEQCVDEAFETCSARAREMCLLYRRLYQSQTIQFTWGSLHILFLGGLTYLYCLWRSAKVREKARRMDVINTCMACNTVLVIIAERWSQATTYRDIFELLSEKTINLVCGDGSQSQSWNHGPDPSQNADPLGQDPPFLQDWIMGLDETTIPQESEWLVRELLQGMGDFQPDGQLLDPTGSPHMNLH